MGILAVALGITAIVKNSALEVLTQFGDAENYDVTSLLRTGAVVLIVGGVFALVVGFLGCCGAWKMHKLMLQIVRFLYKIFPHNYSTSFDVFCNL